MIMIIFYKSFINMAVQDGDFATANDQDPSDGLPGTIFRKCFGIQSLDSLLMSVF